MCDIYLNTDVLCKPGAVEFELTGVISASVVMVKGSLLLTWSSDGTALLVPLHWSSVTPSLSTWQFSGEKKTYL